MRQIFEIIRQPQDIAQDTNCLQKIAAGDRNAFAWLYENYRKKIFNHALLLSGDRVFSEDLVHDVFIAIWQKGDELMKVKDFNAYVYGMIRYRTTDALRRKKHLEKYKQEQLTMNDCILLTEQHAWGDEAKALLRQGAELLPPQQRLIFFMQRVHELKRKEIAAKLQISPNTVKAHGQSTKRFLKRYMEERMDV